VDTTYRIAEIAERSGLKASTLRYYEDIGLLPAPERTSHGYRAYGEGVLDRLAFIVRAKQLGCTLDEIADLLAARATDRCEPVQTRLRQLVAAKVAGAQVRATELAAFTAELQRAAAGLAQRTPEGPCDDRCGCSQSTPVACSLEPDLLPGRLADWHALVKHVIAREPIDEGTRLSFDGGVRAADVAGLAEAEQACCGFFRFAVTLDERGLALEVRGPSEAQHMVAALFEG